MFIKEFLRIQRLITLKHKFTYDRFRRLKIILCETVKSDKDQLKYVQ